MIRVLTMDQSLPKTRTGVNTPYMGVTWMSCSAVTHYAWQRGEFALRGLPAVPCGDRAVRTRASLSQAALAERLSKPPS